MTIGPLDDLPVHQTADPLATPLPRRDHGERYLFAGYDDTTGTLLALAFGLWPGRGVADAALSVARAGTQWTVAASESRPPDARTLRVGPIEIEIVEPLREIAVAVDDDAGLLAADLRFTTRGAPDQERLRPESVPDGDEDTSRFTQLGEWGGSLAIEGQSTTIAAPGCRRRTWGDQPVGERPERGRPLTALPHRVELDLRLLTGRDPGAAHELLAADGSATYHHGALRRLALELVPESRWPTRASYAGPDDRRLEIDFTHRLLLSELGSLDPSWTDAAWKGGTARRSIRRSLATTDASDLAALHTLTAGTVTQDGETDGLALLDALVLGPCPPLGVGGWTDGR